MKRVLSIAVLAFGFAAPAWAQETRAVVLTPAPIYVLPDATRIPLRTAAVNTQLRMIGVEGDWLKVEFQDPQFGRRVGYVETKLVRVDRAELRPMDLSVREPARLLDAPPVPAEDTGRRPVPGKPRPRSGYALMTGGVTFQSETSSAFGAEFGGFVARDLQMYGHGGQMLNTVPKAIQEDLDNLASALRIITRANWEFDAKVPATYFGGGVKYLVPTGVAVRPYILGGVTGARFNVSVREIDLGEITDDLVDDGYLDEEDVRATRVGAEIGGGVLIPIGSHVQIEGGYRFTKFFESQINVSRIVVGFGTRF